MTLSVAAQRFEQGKAMRLEIGRMRVARRLWCWLVFSHPANPRIWF